MTSVPPVRCAVWGMGKLGTELVHAVEEHPGTELVAVVTRRPDAVVGLRTVPPVLATPAEVPELGPGTWVLSARHATGDDLAAELLQCASLGLDVVTSSGLFHPPSSPEPQRELLRRAAETAGSRIVVAGLNPGFLLDVLVGQLLTVCPGWKNARIIKPSTPASWPEGTREFLGIGRPASELDGPVRVPLASSVHAIADILDLQVVELVEEVRAVPAAQDWPWEGGVVHQGAAIGFVQECRAVLRTGPRVTLVWDVSLAHAVADTGLSVTADDGAALQCRLAGSFMSDPYPATASRMLHAARVGSALAPGLHGPVELPPSALAGDAASHVRGR